MCVSRTLRRTQEVAHRCGSDTVHVDTPGTHMYTMLVLVCACGLDGIWLMTIPRHTRYKTFFFNNWSKNLQSCWFSLVLKFERAVWLKAGGGHGMFTWSRKRPFVSDNPEAVTQRERFSFLVRWIQLWRRSRTQRPQHSLVAELRTSDQWNDTDAAKNTNTNFYSRPCFQKLRFVCQMFSWPGEACSLVVPWLNDKGVSV